MGIKLFKILVVPCKLLQVRLGLRVVGDVEVGVYRPVSPCWFGLHERQSTIHSLDDLSSTLVFVTDGFPHRINAEWEPNTAGQVERRALGGLHTQYNNPPFGEKKEFIGIILLWNVNYLLKL